MSVTSSETTLFKYEKTKAGLLKYGGWIWFAAILLLFVVMYSSYIKFMILTATKTPGGKSFFGAVAHIFSSQWNPDWSHVLIVPFISAYFIFRDRAALASTPKRISPVGLVVLIGGLISFMWWVHPWTNDMMQGFSMTLSLFGLVWFLFGTAMIRKLWFPVLYLVFFVKITYAIWSRIAEVLQDVAAGMSGWVLKFFTMVIDFDVTIAGNTINISFMREGSWITEPLKVEEVCSGLRMLMAFVALGVAIAYLADRVWWQRLLMIFLTVPIAIAVNIGRVVTLGLLTMVDPELAHGDFHTMIGMLMLIPAAGIFLLVGWILDHLYVPVDSGAKPRPHGGQALANDDTNVQSQSANQPTGTSPKQVATTVPKNAAVGLLLGLLVACLTGAAYFTMFAAFRPKHLEDSFGLALSQQMAQVVFWVLVVLLVGLSLWTWWYLSKTARQERLSGATCRSFKQFWPLPSTVMALGIVSSVLLTSVVGYGQLIQFNKFILIKEPLPLRKHLTTITKSLGPWHGQNNAAPLTNEILQVLGTQDYITWDYTDEQYELRQPGSMLRLHLAFYTGQVDTIPHVPDRCYISGGRLNKGLVVDKIQLQGSQFVPQGDGYRVSSLHYPEGVTIPKLEIPVTLFQFGDENDSYLSSVVYFFVANGKFLATSKQVRVNAFDLRDRYSYYCKVEILLPNVGDKKLALKRAGEFLSVMMPEIMGCLPDWEQANRVDTDRNQK